MYTYRGLRLNDQERLKLILKEQKKYITENRIEFFGKHDKELDEKFPDMRLKGPNPKQQLILDNWNDPYYEIFTFTGGNRMGKTTLGTILGLSVMFGYWLWNGQKIDSIHDGPRKVRYIGQDWESHIKAVVEPELLKWWPKNRQVERKKNNQGVYAYWKDVKTKSELIVMSNKQDSGTHEGDNMDLAIFDEPPKRDIWIANSRGLVDRRGKAFFAMTLLKEAWVHREIIKRLDEKGLPDKRVFNVVGKTYDNIGYGLTQEGVEQFARTLKPDEIEARLDGKPSYLSGLIFAKFNRETHVKERFKIPLDWPVDVSIDYHPRKPIRWQIVATDPKDRKWVIFEFNQPGNYKYATEELIRIIKYNSLRVENIVCDPLAKGDPNSDLNEEDTFTKISNILYPYGYYLLTANKDENGGITMINELLITETGEPSIFIFRDCPETIQHVEDWMWVEGKPAKDNEDQCENLYRNILIDTKYTAPNQHKSSSSSGSWKTA